MRGAIAGDIIGSRFEGHPAPPTGFALFAGHCRLTDDSVCSVTIASALRGDRDFAETACCRLTPDLPSVLDRFRARVDEAASTAQS